MTEERDKVVEFPARESIELEAATWAARSGEADFSEADQAALDEWLAASERHRAAFRQFAAFWEDAAILRELDDIADAVEPYEAPGKAAGLRWIGVGAAAACLLATLLVPGRPDEAGLVEVAGPRDFATAVGEQRTVDLDDGSSIRMNTGTSLSVAYTPGARRIRLIQGEAFFEVAHDPARPFQVDSSAGSVRALGTSFATRLKDRQVLEVTVAEGVVEVAPPPEPSLPAASTLPSRPEPFQLPAGSRAVYSGVEHEVEAVTAGELARRLSWRDGMIVFSGEPLRLVLDDVSRYTDVDIRISDPSIEDLPIGGYFRVGEVDALLESLEVVFGLRVQRVASGDVLLTRGG